MGEKRRDRKGRVLRTGESQRPDGRYQYKYTDPATRKPRLVYSWKLEPTDRTPGGKKEGPSLRELEKAIQRDIDDGIDTTGRKMTVVDLYQRYCTLHGNVKPKTVDCRERLIKMLQSDKLGGMSIERVKQSDAKEWAVRMKERGVAYNSIANSRRSLSAAFHMAVEDDLVRKNPFSFKPGEVVINDTKKKVPLSKAQADSLLAFVKADKVYGRYYDDIVILLGTGLRISELCGLTATSLDFDKQAIVVDHQLLWTAKQGYYIQSPKTENGVRMIPMSQEVYEALQRVAKRCRPDVPLAVGGHRDFLFLRPNGKPQFASNYGQIFGGILKKYNKKHKEKLEAFTPHLLRHTFCTYKANAGMSPKTLQYIMGHKSIEMTLDYYAHGDFGAAKAEMARTAA